MSDLKIIKKLLVYKKINPVRNFKNRFRDTKYSINLIDNDLYKDWKKANPAFAEKVPNYGTFKKIWNKLMDNYIDETLRNPMGVRLPYYCGDLSLQYINIEYEALDMKKSTALGETVPHLNWNSSDKLGKIIWSVRHASKFNKYLPFLAFRGTTQYRKKAFYSLVNTPNIYKTAKTL